MPSRNRTARVALAAAPALLVAAAGCQQILGLDQFTKDAASECDSAACDGGTADAPDDSPGLDVVLPDVVNPTTSWAKWPMPSSDAEVESGANPDSGAKYVTTKGVAADQITGLQWNLSSSPSTFGKVEDAAAYCATLGPNWRLPTRIELATLLDSSTNPPCVTPALAVDGGVQAALYWTSSYYRPLIAGQLHYWLVNFTTGDVVHLPPTQAHAVCVQ
ncbi:MAG TPA: DUF1566 domain-containing protein [Polyangiaceae bacterium]|nr:DUF1566 domain-containing protein [Polyangiaceae bacterium]